MAEHYKIAIIGSGPAGLSAAAHAAELGVSHILFERAKQYSDTIFKFQKRKHVMATPETLPLRSDLPFKESSREEILGGWNDGMGARAINVRMATEVTAITGEKGAFKIATKGGEEVTAEAVILSIGVQGNLRQLGVPGDNWDRVQYQLDDPDEYQNENIVVIGGGDAGIENALALSAGNNVTIVNNQAEFAYAKPANRALILAAIKDGNMQGVMSASAKQVEPGLLTLNVPDGEMQVKCDRIIARIGALPPRKFVESCGIQFSSPAPTAFPHVSDTYESNVPGMYIVGALAGYPLIKQCMNQGYEVVEYILGNNIPPADEPLIQAKLDHIQPKVTPARLIELIRERLPVYKALTTLQIREMLLSSEVHLKRPGEVIFARNDYTNSFWTIIEGKADIQINPSNPAEVVTLNAGQFFGEMGLISGRRRTATTVAKTDCLLLEVPRNSMIRLQRSVPEVKRVIDEVAIIRQIKTYLTPTVDDAALNEVVASSEIVALKPGEVLIQEGTDDDSVFLIRSGSVTVSSTIGGQEVVLAYLPAGNYVGEMALLTKQHRSATVKAAVASEAIKINSTAFRALLDRAPDLMAQVKGKLESRMRERVQVEARPEDSGLIEFLLRQGFSEATDVLLIDESLCVRCDNCEKACAETHHGVSRLTREAGPTFDSVHVPTSCRHCEHPHCMKDCPPDAIRRAPNGEVFIGDNCIGCGNCERNCPYGVIHMAAVPAEKPSLLNWLLWGSGPGPGEDKSAAGMEARTGSKHATKCDMCKDDPAGPACVRSCPTGAAIRVNPEQFLNFLREQGR